MAAARVGSRSRRGNAKRMDVRTVSKTSAGSACRKRQGPHRTAIAHADSTTSAASASRGIHYRNRSRTRGRWTDGAGSGAPLRTAHDRCDSRAASWLTVMGSAPSGDAPVRARRDTAMRRPPSTPPLLAEAFLTALALIAFVWLAWVVRWPIEHRRWTLRVPRVIGRSWRRMPLRVLPASSPRPASIPRSRDERWTIGSRGDGRDRPPSP